MVKAKGPLALDKSSSYRAGHLASGSGLNLLGGLDITIISLGYAKAQSNYLGLTTYLSPSWLRHEDPKTLFPFQNDRVVMLF